MTVLPAWLRLATSPPARSRAGELDAADPLASLRDRFVCPEPGLIYLDGNSLGMLPRVTARRIGEVVGQQWGAGLVRSWSDWVSLPQQAGDLLGSGAARGGARAGRGD